MKILLDDNKINNCGDEVVMCINIAIWLHWKCRMLKCFVCTKTVVCIRQLIEDACLYFGNLTQLQLTLLTLLINSNVINWSEWKPLPHCYRSQPQRTLGRKTYTKNSNIYIKCFECWAKLLPSSSFVPSEYLYVYIYFWIINLLEKFIQALASWSPPSLTATTN